MSTTSKFVLITGATAGIGRTTALHLAKEGHHVIASGRKVAELEKLKAEAIGTLDTIEPGVIRTNFEATAVSNMSEMFAGAYSGALDKYEKMSKMADKFASNPIVIAKAISRAVRARRASARYVAPRRTSMVFWLQAMF